ncbi:hypothetical protein ACIA74_38250 [Streptomyces sp. NPDC051658]|uniref:hypothetical protein n=1 Tax=Streptomyces sp. NPDC051658 TaxID=3365667 RepID=UPI0037A58F1E
MAAARTVLTGGGAQMLLSALATRLHRSDPSSALLALPATLGNEELQVVAAGVLAALGRPFNSIRQGGGRMWIGEETTAVKEAASFCISTPSQQRGVTTMPSRLSRDLLGERHGRACSVLAAEAVYGKLDHDTEITHRDVTQPSDVPTMPPRRTLAASAGYGRRPHPRSEHDLVRLSLNLLDQQCRQVRKQLQERITRARDT